MMPDREKVIKGLEHCRKTSCESCPYNAADVKSSNPICLINEMLSDALALLKEQDNCENCAIAIEDRQPIVRCKDCKNLGYTNSHWFCKWLNRCVDEDWFCADGEQKEGR
jgi:Zn finger protein HypA/HybF involved in hydrogenase expression